MPRSVTEVANVEKWNTRFAELEEYKAKNGHCKVPQNEANGALGKWVKLQRKKRAQGKMPDDRIERLEKLGFTWSGTFTPKKTEQWQEKFEKLKKLMDDHGVQHSQALQSIAKTDPQLLNWISNQRRDYKDGTLGQEFVAKLDSIGFVWKIDPLWDNYFKALKELVSKHGNVPAVLEVLLAADPMAESVTSPDQEAGAKKGETAAAPTTTTTTTKTESDSAVAAAAEEAGIGIVSTAAAGSEPVNVPIKAPTNKELIEWISEQKTIEHVSSTTVSADQAEMLQQLEGWTWEDNSWTVFYVKLKVFKRTKGHARVSTKDVGDPLGEWVSLQRKLKAYFYPSPPKKSPPSDAPPAMAAADSNSTGQAVKAEVADAMVIAGEVPAVSEPVEAEKADSTKDEATKKQEALAAIEEANKQNPDFGNQMTITPAQIEALDGLGFVWNVVDGTNSWMDMYQQLKEFRELHGHCKVPKRNKKDPKLAKLGVWVGKQRERYKNMTKPKEVPKPKAEENQDDAAGATPKKKVFVRPPLQQHQVNLLNELDFVWEAGAKSDHAKSEWDANLEELKAFRAAHGHANASAKTKGPGGRLGRWIKTQRERYHGSKKKLAPLSEDQIAKLESVEGFSWRPSNHTSPDESWDVMFQEMIKYKEQYGDCYVPQKVAKLGGWVDRQRKRYKVTQQGENAKSSLKPLSQEQISKLTEIGFVWSVKPTPKRKFEDQSTLASAAGAAAAPADGNDAKRMKTEPGYHPQYQSVPHQPLPSQYEQPMFGGQVPGTSEPQPPSHGFENSSAEV